MKKILLFVCICLSMMCSAQQFTNQGMDDFLKKFNEISAQNKSSNAAWAQAILDNNMFNLNNEENLEFSYVIYSTDSFDIKKIKELTIDFIQQNFNLSNKTRSELVQGATENSVYFKGLYSNFATTNDWGFVTGYSAYIELLFKFKENRLKVTITVPRIIWNINNSQTKDLKFMHVVNDFHNNRKALYRDESAIAIINLVSKSFSYNTRYKLFLNEHYKADNAEEEDW